jgi:hypothetical protein
MLLTPKKKLLVIRFICQIPQPATVIKSFCTEAAWQAPKDKIYNTQERG